MLVNEPTIPDDARNNDVFFANTMFVVVEHFDNEISTCVFGHAQNVIDAIGRFMSACDNVDDVRKSLDTFRENFSTTKNHAAWQDAYYKRVMLKLRINDELTISVHPDFYAQDDYHHTHKVMKDVYKRYESVVNDK